MKFEAKIHEIEVKGLKVSVINIPIAASSVQFILADKEINEIRSVGYLDFDGEVTWKEELRKLFKCGNYWEE